MFKRVLFIASLLCSISFSVKAVKLTAYMKTFQATNNCSYQTFNFQDSSSYNGNYKASLKDSWFFSDGAIDTGKTVSRYFSSTGTYTVSLVVTNTKDGIKDSIAKTVTITGTGVLPALTYAGALCERSEVKFKIISPVGTGIGYVTDFGDKSTPVTTNPLYDTTSGATPGIHVYQARGNYNIVVNATTSGGCKSSITMPVNILQRPFARPPFVGSQCQGNTISFKVLQNSTSDTSGMRVTYLWKFPDGSTSTAKTVTKLFKDSGDFHGKLYVINNSGIGCSDSVTNFTIPVNSRPIVKFYMVPHCQDSIAKIYDSSVNEFGQAINSWHWAFYDSNFVRIDTAAGYIGFYNPDSFYYGFPHGGTFYITEYDTTGDGCYDSLQKKVYINPIPTPDFGFRNTCLDSALQFYDSSTVAKGNTVTGWAWNFGDGGKSALQNPAHQYGTWGYGYSVRLIAKTQAGCIDSVRKNVVVYPLPNAGFSAISNCQGVAVSFANNSVMPNGTDTINDRVSRYAWLYGDGTTNDTTKSPTHVFKDSGYHNISLVAFSAHGCSDTSTNPVYVYPLPKPSFTLNDDCERDSVFFINTSKTTFGTLIDSSYTWDFGDTTPFSNTVTNPSHLYQHSDTFNVKLTAKTWDHGCSKDTTIPVIIIPGPHSSFTVGPKCTGSPVPFTNTTFSKNPGTINYFWDFGDGTTSTATSPDHTFPSTGNYRVRLTSYMPATGCTDSTAKIFVSVTPRPVVYFKANNACLDSTVICQDSSYVPGVPRPGDLLSWAWDFGDGHFGSDSVVKHQYAAPGVYTIREYVTSTSQCEDSFIRQVTIYSVPVSNFSYTESCGGVGTPFTSLATPPDSVAAWRWIFSNTDTSTAQNPAHVFQDNDILNASLTVFTANGCPNTKSMGIQIYSSPVADYHYSIKCNGEPITFNNTSQPPAAPDYLLAPHWNFGDTALNDRIDDTSATISPTHTFEYAGKYNVVLTETSNRGCESIDTQAVPVPIIPIPGFTFSGSCVGRQFVFRDTSKSVPPPPANSYPLWYFGDGFQGVGVTQNVHTYLNSGTYTAEMQEFVNYSLQFPGSNLRCISDTVYATVVVNPLPTSKFSSDTACFGNPTIFYDSSVANGGQRISHYDWKYGDGTEDSLAGAQFTHAYKDSFPGSDSTYTAILKVTTNYGCDSSDTQKVFVRQIPYTSFSANPDPAPIQHSQVTFTNTTQHADPNHYYWTFGDGTDSHDISPTHTYKDTGTFIVTLAADNDFCEDTSRYIVYVTPGYTLYAPNCITVNGDGKNDAWMAKGVGVVDYDVVIADRWGQIVFHSEDINKPWNADYNGNGVKVPEGVYVYYIKAGDFSQTNFTTLKGNITVVR